MSKSDKDEIACTEKCSTCGKNRKQRAECTKEFMVTYCSKCKNRENKLVHTARCMDNICVYALE